ncbi:MAG: SDR family oxidoreductase [Oscillospiraceae bacterium]
MKQICVVTGGGSGMGLETAKLVGKDRKIILVGRTVSKLENALNELRSLGIEAEAYPCDAGDREAVYKLAEYASSQGIVKTVIHAAGVSPHMADALKIFRINALGTINIDEAFGAVMGEGGCILNVSSMSGYMLPEASIPRQIYALALTDAAAFEEAAAKMLAAVPAEQSTGMAYSISKNFVIWYTAKMAIRYGKKGIRVVSIAPGTISTPMGDIEGEEAASFALAGALGRVGAPEEIAKLMAFMVSDECSYLTGVDILYDGGSIAAFKDRMEKAGQ